MLNFPFFMDLLVFALKNDMPGNPFDNAKDFILDIVNEAIRYPLNAPLHADSIDTLVNYPHPKGCELAAATLSRVAPSPARAPSITSSGTPGAAQMPNM